MNETKRIAIIGAGISGLAAAYKLRELAPEWSVSLFDPRHRAGGVLNTIEKDGFEMEEGADNFITTVPWGVDLCKRVGIADQLVTTDSRFRQTFVVFRNRLHKLPDGFMMMAPTQMWPLATTGLLSPLGKIRAGLELFIPRKADDADESMAAFGRRRLGREVFERLIEPLVSGVYAADLEKLSVLATMDRFREMEKEHRSLILAMRAEMSKRRKREREDKRARQSGTESGPRYSLFVTLKGGFKLLSDTILQKLPNGTFRPGCRVTGLERISRQAAEGESGSGSGTASGSDSGSVWRLSWEQVPESEFPSVGGVSLPASRPDSSGKLDLNTSESLNSGARPHGSETFDAVIVCAPSYNAADLLRSTDESLAEELGTIAHSGTAIATMAFRREQIKRPVLGMGAVVPKVERSPILALSFSSTKYPHRAPDGTVLIRVFSGGARDESLAVMPDSQLVPLLLEKMRPLLQLEGEPICVHTSHWPNTMPQYYVGHLDKVASIEARVAQLAGLELAGNSYRGVGVPACIHSGEQAALRTIENLQRQ